MLKGKSLLDYTIFFLLTNMKKKKQKKTIKNIYEIFYFIYTLFFYIYKIFSTFEINAKKAMIKKSIALSLIIIENLKTLKYQIFLIIH